MKLIDEEDLKDLQDKKLQSKVDYLKKPEEKDFMNSVKESSFILNKHLPDDLKVALLSSCSRFMARKLDAILSSKEHQYICKPENKTEAQNIQAVIEDPDDLILLTVPSNYRKNAKLLLTHLRRYPSKISWNQVGEVYTRNGQHKILGANIADLLNYVIRTNFKFPNPEGPAGINRLKHILHSTSAPLSLLCPRMRKVLSQPISSIFQPKQNSRKSYDSISRRVNKNQQETLRGPDSDIPEEAESLAETFYPAEEAVPTWESLPRRDSV